MLEFTMCVEFIRHNVNRLRALHSSDEGATAVEYGLIVSLIAAVIVVAVTLLGTKIVAAFGKINAVM
jgi:pilus assembly protein Flp/PilA